MSRASFLRLPHAPRPAPVPAPWVLHAQACARWLISRPAQRTALALLAAVALLIAYLAGVSAGEVRGLDWAASRTTPTSRLVFIAGPNGLTQLDVKPGEQDVVRQLLKEDW